MWSCTACVAAALLIGIAPAHADGTVDGPRAPVRAARKALPKAPPRAVPRPSPKSPPRAPLKSLPAALPASLPQAPIKPLPQPLPEAPPAGPLKAMPEMPPKASPEAAPEEALATSPDAPIEAGKLEVEYYQVEVNTPGVTLGTIEPIDPDDADIDFASNFYLDLESRRANLRLAGFDNELALDWDMRARNLKLRLAGGHMGTFFIAVDGDITLRKKPTIDARLILAIAGQKLELDLPKFRVDAKMREGELQMEFVVPLIDGGF
jgi:hypothetical protein